MMHRHRHKTAILTRPGAKRDPHIFKIPDAIEALNSGLGIGEGWNLNQDQHPNDGNDYEQFDERKCLGRVLRLFHSFMR